MIEVGLFAEDLGHSSILRPLMQRLSEEAGVGIRVSVRNSGGGIGTALSQLRQYTTDLANGIDRFLQVLVVAIDANCDGFNERRRMIQERVGELFAGLVVPAIPDPHIEKWYLADPGAVAAALGEDGVADVPAVKCERSTYKTALRDAFLRHDVDPPAGGIEFGNEIVQAMDLTVARRHGDFDAFTDTFMAALVQLQGSASSS